MYFKNDGSYSTGIGSETLTLEGYLDKGAKYLLTNVGVGFGCNSDGSVRNPRLAGYLDYLQEAGLLFYGTRPTGQRDGKGLPEWEGRFYPTEELIECCIATVPKLEEFEAKYRMDGQYFGGGTPQFVLENGKERYATLDDIEYIAGRAEEEGISLMCLPLKCTYVIEKGVPKEERKLRAIETQELAPYRALAKNYSGTIVLEPKTQEGRDFVLQLARADKGKRDYMLSAAPCMVLNIDDGGFNNMMDCLDTGLDFFCPSMLTAGYNSPANLFGTAMHAVAEAYIGLMWSQIHSPGRHFLSGPYANIKSTSCERIYELGAPALTMANHMIYRALKEQGIPCLPSGATSNETGFNPQKMGKVTNKDVEDAMQWLSKRKSWVRHGIPACGRDQLSVDLELFDRNLEYIREMKGTAVQRDEPLPIYLMEPNIKDLVRASDNGRKLRTIPDILQKHHLDTLEAGILGDFRNQNSQRNLGDLNRLPFSVID